MANILPATKSLHRNSDTTELKFQTEGRCVFSLFRSKTPPIADNKRMEISLRERKKFLLGPHGHLKIVLPSLRDWFSFAHFLLLGYFFLKFEISSDWWIKYRHCVWDSICCIFNTILSMTWFFQLWKIRTEFLTCF